MKGGVIIFLFVIFLRGYDMRCGGQVAWLEEGAAPGRMMDHSVQQ